MVGGEKFFGKVKVNDGVIVVVGVDYKYIFFFCFNGEFLSR